MSGTRSRFFFAPTRTHAPRKRFAAAMRASPLPAGGSGGLCARLRRARGKRSGWLAQCRPFGVKATGKIPLPAAKASPRRVNPLPQAARAAPAQRRIFVRTEARVSDRAQSLTAPLKCVDEGLSFLSTPNRACFPD